MSNDKNQENQGQMSIRQLPHNTHVFVQAMNSNTENDFEYKSRDCRVLFHSQLVTAKELKRDFEEICSDANNAKFCRFPQEDPLLQ